MSAWKYQKPGWFINIPIIRFDRGYNPHMFEARPVHKPSGAYSAGGFSAGIAKNSDVHGRTGQYNTGGHDASQNTFVAKDGSYKPGNAKSLSVEAKTRPYNTGGMDTSAKAPEDTDPYGNYLFHLSITAEGEEHTVATFLECSGLKNACTVFEFEEGGLNHRSNKFPGQSKWENLVLRYATSSSLYMAKWRDSWLLGEFDKRTKYSGAITLKNNFGDAIQIYEFTNAWPVSWEGPSLNSGGSELAVETLELAHDGLTIKPGSSQQSST